MDLYMTHWDEQKGNWGEPVNMGRAFNTEGDEIYPRVVGDALYFAPHATRYTYAYPRSFYLTVSYKF